MITVDTTLSQRYHLESLIGQGGMADVFRARDLVLERPVAVKVVRGAGDEDSQRFAREVRTMAALSHPSIVALFDAGTHEGGPYLVMELVEGSDLPSLLAGGPLDAATVASTGRQLARGLTHAHGLGVVHRDVKPANILIDESGRARLSDFGIARLADATRVTTPGMTSGTAGYLAPEQLEGADVGPPADIYSLGLVLLEALTGRKEYTGTPVEAAMARLTRDPAIPDDLPEPWVALLEAMTDRDPARRPSAGEVAARLSGDAPAAGASGQTVALRARAEPADDPAPQPGEEAPPPSEEAPPPPRPAGRRGAVLATVALLVVAAVFVLLVFREPDGPPPDDPPPPGDDPTLPTEVDDALRRLEEAVRR